MSLVAHILFERPTTLPAGTRRRHMMEDGYRRSPDAPPPASHKNQAAKSRNIEAVHTAVAGGAKTHAELEDVTGLSQSTVKKALYALEEWPGGPRISRDRRFVTHTFEAIG